MTAREGSGGSSSPRRKETLHTFARSEISARRHVVAPSGGCATGPADVEDMRLRIEAHKRASEAEAASARAFRSECERAHGEFLRACARLEEERRARHAKQLEVMEATYARARLATPAVSAESLALRGLARGIARGLAARESARGGTLREDEGVVVRPEKNAASKNAASTASRSVALAALERAASGSGVARARESAVARASPVTCRRAARRSRRHTTGRRSSSRRRATTPSARFSTRGTKPRPGVSAPKAKT